MREKWNDLGVKDKIQYIMAIVLISAGIIMAFLSFFLNAFNIATGTLIFIAQCFVMSGGIFGISIYFKNKLGEFKSDATKEIQQILDKLIKDKE